MSLKEALQMAGGYSEIYAAVDPDAGAISYDSPASFEELPGYLLIGDGPYMSEYVETYGGDKDRAWDALIDDVNAVEFPKVDDG